MAEVVGHWNNLDEAKKLTQSVLLQGVIETVINQGLILPMMGVKMLKGKSLLYNREKDFTISEAADFYSVHQQIPWQADQEYDQIEVELKRIARADQVDRFLSATYDNVNDYDALVVQEVVKKVMLFTEHRLIYGDTTYTNSKEFDGLHALNQGLEAFTASGVEAEGKVNVDMGETALSLLAMRRLADACKIDQRGRDNVAWIMPRQIARRIDSGYNEAAFVRSSVTVTTAQSMIGAKEIGGRIMEFDGIPIIRNDVLTAEQANTGVGTNARALYSSSTRNYSIFLVRFGNVEDAGLEMLFGDAEAQGGQFTPFRHEQFDKLEGFDAGGHRLIGYMAPALGAAHSLGRIFDITDVEVTP
jgi:hypothetical protein